MSKEFVESFSTEIIDSLSIIVVECYYGGN